jgi:hypothetical protein
MVGTTAARTNGHPWPGGPRLRFERAEVRALGHLSAYNDFVVRYLVRLADDREVFVKLADQPEADRRWLQTRARRINRELRARVLDGSRGFPTRDVPFILTWFDVA